MVNLLIWGTGGHAGVIAEALPYNPDRVLHMTTDPKQAKNLIKGRDGEWYGILGLGDRAGRLLGGAFLDESLPLETVLHRDCFWCGQSSMGSGSFLAVGSVLGVKAKVGHHCIINTCASVDHDCRLSDHVIVGPGARLCGGVKVGFAALVGAGAVVLPKVTIDEYATVGAGAVVTKNVPPYAVVMGNPARVVRYATKETLPC